MALLHVRHARACWISAICLSLALMSAMPNPAHAISIRGTIDVQPDNIGDANDEICSQFDEFFPPCAPALITFSLRLDRPGSLRYSFDWTSGPPLNRHVFGDSEFLSEVEQFLGKPEFVTRSFSNSWDGTNLGIDFQLHAEFPRTDVSQHMQFNTATGSPGGWGESIDGDFGFGGGFTTISSDLTVVPEPPPLLILLTAFGALFGIAKIRLTSGHR